LSLQVVEGGCNEKSQDSVGDYCRPDLAGAPMSLVLGGMHLYKNKKEDIDRIITQLLEMGVQQIGACHCSGDTAIAAVCETFGDNFVEVAVGTRVEV